LERERDRSDNVVVLQSVQRFACMGIPDLAACVRELLVNLPQELSAYRLVDDTHAEKSAAAVAAMLASVDRRACHTAPL